MKSEAAIRRTRHVSAGRANGFLLSDCGELPAIVSSTGNILPGPAVFAKQTPRKLADFPLTFRRPCECRVIERLGSADETRNDEAIRGPGAEILIYRDSRCAVHLLDGKAEFID